MLKSSLAIALLLLLGARSLTGYTTSGTGTTTVGGASCNVTWSSYYDGSAGDLDVVVAQGSGLPKIVVHSLSWGYVLDDGTAAAQGQGYYLGQQAIVYLTVSPGSPVGCSLAIYQPQHSPPVYLQFPVTVSSGSLTTH